MRQEKVNEEENEEIKGEEKEEGRSLGIEEEIKYKRTDKG